MKAKKLRKKLHSKKGLTLVEILVGVTIVVIVFASTLGAMVGGFTTTMYNSDENKAAILNASLNEIIMNVVGEMNVNDSDAADDLIMDVESGDPSASPIIAAVSAAVPEAKYVPATIDGSGNPTVVFSDDVDYQFSLIPNVSFDLDTHSPTGETVAVKGIQIKTKFASASGDIIYESFVPFLAFLG